MRFELTTPTLARLCSTPELRPRHRNAVCTTRALCTNGRVLTRCFFPLCVFIGFALFITKFYPIYTSSQAPHGGRENRKPYG